MLALLPIKTTLTCCALGSADLLHSFGSLPFLDILSVMLCYFITELHHLLICITSTQFPAFTNTVFSSLNAVSATCLISCCSIPFLLGLTHKEWVGFPGVALMSLTSGLQSFWCHDPYIYGMKVHTLSFPGLSTHSLSS